MSNYLTNKRGVALIWVLMIMLVLPILATAVLNVAVAENKFATRQEDKLQAYYIARSGAQAIAEHMLRDPGGAINLISHTSAWNNQIGGGRFMVTVSEGTQGVDVVSVGELRGLQQTAKIRLTRSVPGIGGVFQHAIAARNTIGVHASGEDIQITGSVATPLDNTISLGRGTATGGQVTDLDMIFPPIVVPHFPQTTSSAITSTTVIHSTPTAPTFVRANHINLKKDSLTIVGDGIVHMYVNGNINLKNASLRIPDKGIVHMYVNGNINFETNSQLDVASGATLFVYVIGERTITFSGSGSQHNVFLYAPDSTIVWNNAQPSAVFNGAIIGNNVTLHNQLNITYNSLLVNDVALDRGAVGPTFTGYVFVD